MSVPFASLAGKYSKKDAERLFVGTEFKTIMKHVTTQMPSQEMDALLNV